MLRTQDDFWKRGAWVKMLAAFAVALTANDARAATINFETLPSLPAQPNTFVSAGTMQTYSSAGLFSVTGGVVLGNPTFLASFPAQGSAPNAYGTADFADPSLLDTITFTFPGSAMVTGVSFMLFNGQPIAETYTATSFSPANVLLTNITFIVVQAVSSSSGFRNVAFMALPGLQIGRIAITTPNAAINGWDFFVDTVALTQETSNVPEPASIVLLGTGIVALFARRRVRRD